MSRASHLLVALTTAAQDNAACREDDRFTADLTGRRTTRVAASMRAVCESCPLFDLCEQTADALQPSAGFWAGKSYNANHLTARHTAALG